MNRKTFFSDTIYPLLSKQIAERQGIELVYGGVGHPSFHYEVYRKVSRRIEQAVASDPQVILSVATLSHWTLEEFQRVRRRRTDDKLRFLFGFDTDDFNRGSCLHGRDSVPIGNTRVRNRALEIVRENEKPGYAPLSPANHACLVGVDPVGGYTAFSLKSEDGVLAFQSCGFESIGQGRIAGAMRFARELNGEQLEHRRTGMGKRKGLFILLDAALEANDHFGQVGGNIRLLLLDGAGAARGDRLREISDQRAHIARELVQAVRAGLFAKETGCDLLYDLAYQGRTWQEVERAMFEAAPDVVRLEKFLRGYKVHEAGLAIAPDWRELYGESVRNCVPSVKGTSDDID